MRPRLAAAGAALLLLCAGPAGAEPPVAPDRLPSLNELIATLTGRWKPECWGPGPKTDVVLRVRLGADGRLVGRPEVVGRVDGEADRAAREAATRAVESGQPYRVPREAAGVPITVRFSATSACREAH